MDYSGSCHCGAIGFVYRTEVSPAEWSIRACQCSFCRAHDALSTSDTAGRLDFQAAQPEKLQRYRFGLKTADFLLCRQCGVYIGAEIATETGRFGIINTHTLKPTPNQLASTLPIVYDNENTSGRIERRMERWTPVGQSAG